jgi:hypothetical protein
MCDSSLSRAWMSLACPSISYSNPVQIHVMVFGTWHHVFGFWRNMPPPYSGYKAQCFLFYVLYFQTLIAQHRMRTRDLIALRHDMFKLCAHRDECLNP